MPRVIPPMPDLACAVNLSHVVRVSSRSHLMTIVNRQEGRTTLQLLNAPWGAVFVWCNDHLHYPGDLARFLGRRDLKIIAPRDIRKAVAFGRHAPFVVDHTATLTSEQQAIIARCNERFAA